MWRSLLLVLTLLQASVAWSQCPPLCGADPEVPNHYRVPDVQVSVGELVKIPVWFEGYQIYVNSHFRFELDPSVAEFVGTLPGPDAPLIGHGGPWHLDDVAWVKTANEEAEHPGWQLNYIEFANWGLPDICSIDAKVWGSLGGFRDLGIRTEFLLFYIVIQANAPGVTPIWFDRDCNGEPWGSGPRPGPRDSFLTFFVENACLRASASACISEDGLASLSPVPWQPSVGKPMMPEYDPVVVVNDDDCDAADDDCVGIEGTDWGRVKGLYR